VEITGPWGRCAVRPGATPGGTQLAGPELATDSSARLAKILDRKGAQTRGAGIAWIWVEDHGGVHPLTPFVGMPLSAKVRALTGVAEPVLTERPHLAGVAWSRVTRRWPLPTNDHAEERSGVALRRGLPIEHLRETVIINRRLILPNQTLFLAQLCDREPLWLE
jgi:hypothetical protein